LPIPDPLAIGDGLKGDSKFSILLLIGDSFLLNLCPESLCQIGGGLSFFLGILKNYFLKKLLEIKKLNLEQQLNSLKVKKSTSALNSNL